MEQAYAQALWNLLDGGMEPRKAISALHAQLKKSGRTALSPRVARAFARLAQRKTAARIAILSIAKKHDEDEAHTKAIEALKKIGVSDAHMQTHIDDSLIGGWRVETSEILVDASYKKYLLGIYNKVTSAI